MTSPVLFAFADYWWLYAVFTAGVLGLLALDLGVVHRGARTVSVREAVGWSAAWVSLALVFNAVLYLYARHVLAADARLVTPGSDPGDAAWQTALEFLTGYLIEYSLSVDNIFVFVLVLRYFAVPPSLQHRVLFYGILGALVFRGVFIAVGSVLMQFHWVVWLFGAFLVVTGVKMGLSRDASVQPERSPLLRLLRRMLPVTDGFRGYQFLVREGGRLWATPLLVALVCLEATDIVFAIDSVPAIYALTREPFVVFTSNVFAILGLRSMYFLLGDAVERFHLLRYGLAVILTFVGFKMLGLDCWLGAELPIAASLAVIASVLALSIVLSLRYPRRAGEADAAVR